MLVFLLLFLATCINEIYGAVLCDNPSGPDCNPISTFNFANQESVSINYPVAAPTTVNGITYDVVIQWTHQIGEVISFSWEVYPDNKRDRFDCSTTKMWFDGIEVGATTYFRGRRNDEPYCVFNMQNGILSNSYLQNPAQTVYFLFNDITDDGVLIWIDKNRDLPIIPSDSYDPNSFDPTIVCVDPNGPLCNPISNINFDTATVSIDYPAPGNTDAINAGIFDVVIQWVPPLNSDITSSWKVYPDRVQDPFDCTNSRLWLNGTVVSATTGVDGGGVPYCIFDIHDGVLTQSYIDSPGRTVFFLFDTLIGAQDTFYIVNDFSKPIVSFENYDPINDNPSIICDDPSPATCNVISNVYFTGTITSNLLTFTSPGSTIINGVDYDMVIKWIGDTDDDLDFTWSITPVRVQDPFDCSTTKIWINGTIFSTITGVNSAGNSYCYFDITDGVIPQEIIDDPSGKVFFLLDNPLLGPDDEFNLAIDFAKPIISIENYDPVASNPSIVCDDSNGPNCNVISNQPFITDPTTLSYTSNGITTVQAVNYNSVVKWNVDPSTIITHSWEIYPDRRQDLTTCDGVKMWFNGTIVGSTLYFRGAQNTDPYCVVDMQYGVLSNTILNNPYNKVFFLFDNSMPLGSTYYIAKNFDEPIVSRENIIFYLYDRVATTAVTDNDLGTTFTVTVEELTYPEFPEFQGIGNYELTFAELQLQSITVTVEDPNNPGVTIAQRTFHKGDKVALEEFQFSKYYEDAHFCTWHNSSNLCPVFYDEDSTRVNAFYFTDIQPRIGDICQLTGDTSIKDYFSFLPSNWFASIQLPEISVNFDIIATIEFCDGRSSRRRMLQGSSTVTTVSYVQYSTSNNIQTILFTGGGGNSTSAPTSAVVPTSAPTTVAPATSDDVNIPLIAGLSAGASVSCCFFIFIATRRRRRRDKEERYDRIQYN